MKHKRFFTAILALMICLMLCGCDFIDYYLYEDSANEAAANTSAQVYVETSAEESSKVTEKSKSEQSSRVRENSKSQQSSNVQESSKSEKETPILKSHYIDVGQGDSEFLELPDGKTMLIDAGVYDSGKIVAEYIKNTGCSKIDYLIATHPHSDHIGGMREIINNFKVGQMYMPEAVSDSYGFEKLLKAIEKNNVKLIKAKSGMTIDKNKDLDLKVDILAPNSASYKSLNDYSIVVRVKYKDSSFIYMGDAETTSEAEIMKKYPDVTADVVKVGHHGSVSSSSRAFVNYIEAKYAIISVGKGNDYGHPHNRTLNRWENTGAKVYRTDLNGTILITSDGKKYKVKTERKS